MGTAGTLRGYGYEHKRVPVEWNNGALRFRYDIEQEKADGQLEGVSVWGDEEPTKVIYTKHSETPSTAK